MLSTAAKNVARLGVKAFPKSFANKAVVGRCMPLVGRSMSTLQEKGMSEETKYIRQQEAAAMKKKLDEILASEGSEEERTEMKKILGKNLIRPNCYICFLFFFSYSSTTHALLLHAM